MSVEAPAKEPEVLPKVEPRIDPDRRLNPDRLCPAQKERIVKEINE